LRVPCPYRDENGRRCAGWFKLDNLVRDRQAGLHTCRCNECTTEHDLSQLLTGFPAPASLRSELDTMPRDPRLEEIAVQMRRLVVMTGTEVNDCPRLFTITQQKPRGWHRLKTWERHYTLTLWCEHPGYEHSLPEAGYELGRLKEWAHRIGPYVSVVFQILQLVGPAAGLVTGLSQEQLELMNKEFESMEKVAELLSATEDDPKTLMPQPGDSALALAEGESLRAFRTLLFEVDRSRGFGGLRRVVAPEGHFLWVCPEHYPCYDPGLPTVPAATPEAGRGAHGSAAGAAAGHTGGWEAVPERVTE
jgi:hypothetical protein